MAAPRRRELIGRRVEDVLEHRDQHFREQPAEQRREREGGRKHERRFAPEECRGLTQRCAERSHRRELLAPLGEPDADEERHRGGSEQECKDLFDAADPAEIDSRDRARRLRELLPNVPHGRAVAARLRANGLRERNRIALCGREHDVRPRVVRDGLQIRQVRHHERVFRRRRELLHDADDVEGHDLERARGAVEHAEPEQVAE